MPNILIREVDAINPLSYQGENNTVFIPGLMGTTGAANKNEFVLVKTLTEFTKAFGTAPAEVTPEQGNNKFKDTGWIMAYELVRLGMPVLYYAIDETTEDEIIKKLQAADFWAPLKDRGTYDVRFITSGGYCDSNFDNIATSITKQMADVVNIKVVDDKQVGRADAIALIDLVSGKETATAVMTEFDKLVASKDIPSCEALAAFYPWCNIATVSNGETLLPPSYCYLAAYASAIKYAPSYYAMAGATRGVVPNMVSPAIKFTDADIAVLQSRAAGKLAVNPICYINPFGCIVWGNRTLKVNEDKEANNDGLTAMSFLNVRNCISTIKKVLFYAARKFTFEQNTNILWTNIKAAITPTLDRMVTGNGIVSYSLRKEETDEKAKLKATVSIRPIEAVEDFDLTIYVTDTVEVIG